MKKGDMVKFREPVDIYEEDQRFVVLEDREDRMLVGLLIYDLPFGGISVYRTEELTIAMPYEEGKEMGLADSGKAEPFLNISPYPAGSQERLDWSRGYQEAFSQ